MVELVGQLVEDRFVVEEALGAGGMGVVYRGRHVRLGRAVAIKVLHDHLLGDPVMMARFEREARLAARLHHPNIAGVLDLGWTADGRRLMVLEHAPGASLGEVIAKLRGAPMDRARIIAVVRALLGALDHAHGVGLVHRDLKPENVIVETLADGSDVPRIIDFGIAVLRDPASATADDGRRLTTQGVVLGTPAYMAPEQARDQAVDGRTDLFALGVIAYELLAGHLPFAGSGVEIIMANVSRDPPAIGGGACPALEQFARTLMARDQAARFASAYAALHALDELAAAHGAACPCEAADDAAITQPRMPRMQ